MNKVTIPTVPAGVDLPGVFFLRTLDDCRGLSERLSTAGRVAIIGGGWIGLEVAATATQRGVDVVVIEAGSRLCGRSVPESISEFLLRRHLAAGAQVHLNSTVDAIEVTGPEEKLEIRTSFGPIVCDLVVIGVGQIPNVELAVAAGLSVDNGVIVDEFGRSSDSRIFAAGDVSNHPNLWGRQRLRLESWANAQNQAIAVGRTLMGEAIAYDEIPWFWSDQYDINLQVIGIPDASAESITRGSIAHKSFTIFQLKEGRLVAALGINTPREVKLAKRWMKSGMTPAASQLQDPTVRLDLL